MQDDMDQTFGLTFKVNPYSILKKSLQNMTQPLIITITSAILICGLYFLFQIPRKTVSFSCFLAIKTSDCSLTHSLKIYFAVLEILEGKRDRIKKLKSY